METTKKDYTVEKVVLGLAFFLILIFAGFSYNMPIVVDAPYKYHLVHSDTAYTYTSTRGDGMTIINYYDKDKK